MLLRVAVGEGSRGMASLWCFPAPTCAHILPRRSWCCGGKEGRNSFRFLASPGFSTGVGFGCPQVGRVLPPHCPCSTSSTGEGSAGVTAVVVPSVPTASTWPAAAICGTEGKLDASHHFLLPSWLQCCCPRCPFHQEEQLGLRFLVTLGTAAGVVPAQS